MGRYRSRSREHADIKEGISGRTRGGILTTLSLKFADSLEFMSLSLVAKLPRHLQTLEIRLVTVVYPLQTDFKLESVFPPNLVHLWLEVLSSIEILDYLPSTLQTLRFSRGNYKPETRWKLSKIPKGLISLNMDLSSRELDVDAPLPSTLEIFESLCAFDPRDKLTSDHLPKKKLQKIPDSLFYRDLTHPALESVFQSFPNLESARTWSTRFTAPLPEMLKELDCLFPISIDTALPSTLKDLSLVSPPLVRDLKNLPSSLTSLKISGSCDFENLVRQELSRPWMEPEFAQIASIMCLTNLVIEWRYIASGTCLAPLAKMKTLKKLKLSLISWDGVVSTPTWLPQCLPPNLKDLDLISGAQTQAGLSMPPDEDFLHLWDIKAVTPSLTSLKLTLNNELKDFMFHFSPKFFGSLPRGLLKLGLDFRHAVLHVGALAQLPRSLQRFNISLDGESCSLTNDLFEGLPLLAEFGVGVGNGRALTAELFDIIPKSIIRGWIWKGEEYMGKGKGANGEEAKNMTNIQLQEFLHSNRSGYEHYAE